MKCLPGCDREGYELGLLVLIDETNNAGDEFMSNAVLCLTCTCDQDSISTLDKHCAERNEKFSLSLTFT